MGTERWIFVVTDGNQNQILGKIAPFSGKIMFVILDLTQFPTHEDDLDFRDTLASSLGEYIKKSIRPDLPTKYCTHAVHNEAAPDLLQMPFEPHEYPFIYKKNSLAYNLRSQILMKNLTTSLEITKMSHTRGIDLNGKSDALVPLKRHLKIGIVIIEPWMFYKKNEDGEFIKDPLTGKKQLTGFLAELLEEYSKQMNFEYELIIAPSYGKQNAQNNTWNGIVGLIIDGEIDIAIADLTTTLKRQEVVEFVSPYFFHSGFAILFRMPVKEGSMFKFIDVLQKEVWIAILIALLLTALLLWFLERHSPYSERNNASKSKERTFGFIESLWFATTSFTPQGGGESPKSISGQILVSIYWLFAAIILAVFSANLAALLTVERMETSINDLDDLVMQTNINYTVVQNSSAHAYIRSLAKAENDIYNNWKDASLKEELNRYGKVWNYPVNEMYKRILKAIELAGPAKTEREGYDRVLNDERGLFALIHDVRNIRYEFYSNCKYAYMSNTFAEQPIAMAVRHGSSLYRELSRATLNLQKNYVMDSLEIKYWNASLRDKCQTEVDSEGITPRSMEGAFYCAIGGMAVSLIVLAYETLARHHEEAKKKRARRGASTRVKMGNQKIAKF